MHTYFQDREAIHLILEFVIGGEMFSRLRDLHKFSDDTAKFYAAEVACALNHIHSRNFAYRDLKPENLLIDGEGHIKITDFGFCKEVTGKTHTLCGTPEYLAPEIIKNKGHGRQVDWWGLGILIYEMLTGFPPFYDQQNNPAVIYKLILANNIKWHAYITSGAKTVIQNLLQHEIPKRLGCGKRGSADVMSHTWFRGIDWARLEARNLPPPWVPKFSSKGDTRNFDNYNEGIPRLRNLTSAEAKLFKDF